MTNPFPAFSVRSHPSLDHLLRAKDLADAPLRRASHRGRSRRVGPFVDCTLQPRVPPCFPRDTARLRADAPAGASCGDVADDRPRGRGDIIAVGLSSVGSFTTTFTRVYGKTPTAYRADWPPASAHVVVPACIVRAYRPATQPHVSRRLRAGLIPSVGCIISIIATNPGGDDVSDR